jgi:hypothetical protein
MVQIDLANFDNKFLTKFLYIGFTDLVLIVYGPCTDRW